MGKDPAFLFYSSDFLLGTMVMSFEDKGKYITILSYMHQNGRINEEIIHKLTGHISANLKLKFKIDENGLWYNERLEEEVSKRQHFVMHCIANGRLGGRPAERNEKENMAEKEKRENESFERFWKMYDKPTEKQTCALRWKKLAKKERNAIFEKLPAYVNATPERRFRKNPLTYLTRKIWLDELLPEPPKELKKSAFELLVETGKYQ